MLLSTSIKANEIPVTIKTSEKTETVFVDEKCLPRPAAPQKQSFFGLFDKKDSNYNDTRQSCLETCLKRTEEFATVYCIENCALFDKNGKSKLQF